MSMLYPLSADPLDSDYSSNLMARSTSWRPDLMKAAEDVSSNSPNHDEDVLPNRFNALTQVHERMSPEAILSWIV